MPIQCIGTYNSIALTHRILLVCWVGLLVWLGFVCFFVHAFLDFLSPLLVCIFSYGKEVSDMERTLCRELLKAEVQESMNKCIGRCDITEMMKMKTAVNAVDYNSSVNVCILPKPIVAFSLNFRWNNDLHGICWISWPLSCSMMSCHADCRPRSVWSKRALAMKAMYV